MKKKRKMSLHRKKKSLLSKTEEGIGEGMDRGTLHGRWMRC
jgi:hypothetical protein